MTNIELIKKYNEGERSFRWANLRGADLSGADLSGADLRWADLRGAEFNDKTILYCGQIGGALSSGRTTTFLVLNDKSIHCFTGCFSGSLEELDKQSEEGHTAAHRKWYESAIAHIRLTAQLINPTEATER